MIQRIQTLFLVISSLIFIIMIFTPMGEIETDNFLIYFYPQGIQNNILQATMIFQIILIISSIMLHHIIIVLYKKRKLQLRLASILIFVVILIIGLELFHLYYISKEYKTFMKINIAMIFPFVCLILIFIAKRYIRKDEELVQSLNRIR